MTACMFSNHIQLIALCRGPAAPDSRRENPCQTDKMEEEWVTDLQLNAMV